MRRLLSIALLGAWMLPAAPLMVGCDETLEHEKSVDVKDDGTTVTKEKEVTKNADGSVTETHEKSVDR